MPLHGCLRKKHPGEKSQQGKKEFIIAHCSKFLKTWRAKTAPPKREHGYRDTDNTITRPGCPVGTWRCSWRGHIRHDVDYGTVLFKYYRGNNPSCGALVRSHKLFKYRHTDTPLINTGVMSWQGFFLHLLCFSGSSVPQNMTHLLCGQNYMKN